MGLSEIWFLGCRFTRGESIHCTNDQQRLARGCSGLKQWEWPGCRPAFAGGPCMLQGGRLKLGSGARGTAANDTLGNRGRLLSGLATGGELVA